MAIPSDVQRLTPLTIAGPAGDLEALLQTTDGETHGIAALICHPHPARGGTMHNKVVHRLASTLLELGVAVLRFNFRGVGKSAGHFDHGVGELDDARAAFGALTERFPNARRWVAGFSFGSWIAARLGAAESGIERLILVAPPVRTASFEVLRSLALPKLVLQGTRDQICPLERLEREFALWAEPKRLVEVEGGTHFFDKQLAEFSDALREALVEPAKGGTS